MTGLVDLLVVMTTDSAAYAASISALTDVIDNATAIISGSLATPPEAPTPCAEFDVETLRSHLQAVILRINAMGQGRPAVSVPELVPASDPVAAWREAAAQTAGLWAARDPQSLVRAPWRELPTIEAAEIYAAEVVCHTWDLAAASGQSYDIDEQIAEVCERAYQREIPAESRREIFDAAATQMPAGVPWSDPFGPAVPVAEGARNIDRVVALSGRDPAWRA